MKKPLIGITCNFERNDEIGIMTDMGVKLQKWQFLADNYINAVERAGGIPIILPICEDFETVKEILAQVQGVIVSGGNDVSPACYGEEADGCGEIVPERDGQDLAIVQYLMQNSRMPVLGICRGIQVMNVALGGVLYQDVEKAGFRQHSLDDSPMNQAVHTVTLEPQTRLQEIFQTDVLRVNSYHHSAVKRLAEPCLLSGTSDDGIIEALELPGERFFLAVQWHPEMMYDDELQKRLFSAFVAACAAHTESGG